MILNKEFW